MVGKELVYRRNKLLFILTSSYYGIQVMINIFNEGIASIFPPAILFSVFAIAVICLIRKKVDPMITMYIIISCMYIYFFFLLNDSPYIVNYLFMWLALPLCAIYQKYHVVIIAGIASVLLTFYCFFYLYHDIFPNVEKGDFVYLVLFGIFITTFLITFIHQVKGANAKLQKLAYYDPLTGAANRLLLKEKFTQLKHKKVESIALLFLDMNGFKKVNDTYGHEVGDQLLKRVVAKVHDILDNTDLLCRLGGDEFVILSSNMDNPLLETISKRIQFTLDEPIILNKQKINVTASIGWYSTTDVQSANLEMMIKEADKAMYRVKGSELMACDS